MLLRLLRFFASHFELRGFWAISRLSSLTIRTDGLAFFFYCGLEKWKTTKKSCQFCGGILSLVRFRTFLSLPMLIKVMWLCYDTPFRYCSCCCCCWWWCNNLQLTHGWCVGSNGHGRMSLLIMLNQLPSSLLLPASIARLKSFSLSKPIFFSSSKQIIICSVCVCVSCFKLELSADLRR